MDKTLLVVRLTELQQLLLAVELLDIPINGAMVILVPTLAAGSLVPSPSLLPTKMVVRLRLMSTLIMKEALAYPFLMII
jgi:hypothetical protein